MRVEGMNKASNVALYRAKHIPYIQILIKERYREDMIIYFKNKRRDKAQNKLRTA